MADKYHGQIDDRKYSGDAVDIRYSLKRCIHAKECVTRLSSVFDLEKRPWIDANGASGDEVAQVLQLCPSGALHYERKDEGAAEAIPEENRIILWHNGPMQVKGNLSIQGANVDIEQETRVTLCRCGASEHKPFCDNTHKAIDFVAEAFVPKKEPNAAADVSDNLSITATNKGPLQIEGNFRIETQDGDLLYTGSKTGLCRCGNSQNKPFCDGTHNKIGFDAE
jgi:CDGSH-type Zn-finger protein/uncharacterized Fe-S cluster protein YjdI